MQQRRPLNIWLRMAICHPIITAWRSKHPGDNLVNSSIFIWSWFQAASRGGMSASVTDGKERPPGLILSVVYLPEQWTFLVATQRFCGLITVRATRRRANKEMCILPHRGIFQGFFLTMRRHRVTASCLKLFYMWCKHFLLLLQERYNLYIYMCVCVYNTGRGNRAVQLSGLWRILNCPYVLYSIWKPIRDLFVLQINMELFFWLYAVCFSVLLPPIQYHRVAGVFKSPFRHSKSGFIYIYIQLKSELLAPLFIFPPISV